MALNAEAPGFSPWLRRAVAPLITAGVLGALYGPSATWGWAYEAFCLKGDWRVFLIEESAAVRYAPLGPILMGAFDTPAPLRFIFLSCHVAAGSGLAILAHRFTGSIWGAVAASAIFVANPHHTEAVLWIGAATYYAPMLVCVVCALLSHSTRGWGGSLPGLMTTYAFGTVGILFHEQAVVLPVLLAVLDAARPSQDEDRRRRWLGVGSLALSSIAVSSIKLYAAMRWGEVLGIEDLTVLQRVTNLAQAIGVSLPVPWLVHGPGALGFLVLIAAPFAIFRFDRLAAALVCGWLVSLLPAGLFAMPQARYDYLPSVFVALTVGRLFHLGWSGRRSLRGVSCLALVAMVALGVHDFPRRRAAWRMSSRIHDRTRDAIISHVERAGLESPTVGILNLPDELTRAREIQIISLFRGCFELALHAESERRDLDATFTVARTSECENCSADLPLGDALGADLCMTYDVRARAPRRTTCPAERDDRVPPIEGRLPLSVTASGYNESELNDLYEAAHVIDGVVATEWHSPDESSAWLDLNLVNSPSTRELWVLNGHNPGYEDRSARRIRIEVFDADELRWTRNLTFARHEASPRWRRLDWPSTPTTRVRVHLLEWHGLGGALAEVVVR